jgi:hypothetical protein
VEIYCRGNNIPFKILLTVDSAPNRPAHLDDIHPNVKGPLLPPDTTSFLHPMKQVIIANFKAYSLTRTFAQAVEATKSRLKLHEFWKSYNIYPDTLTTAKAQK